MVWGIIPRKLIQPLESGMCGKGTKPFNAKMSASVSLKHDALRKHQDIQNECNLS